MNALSSVRLKYSKTDATLNNALLHDIKVDTDYSGAGRLNSKATLEDPNGAKNLRSNLDYSYSTSEPHQVHAINHSVPASPSSSGQESFEYNNMGSLKRTAFTQNGWTGPNRATEYCWTEDQRLKGIMQEYYNASEELISNSFHHYVYDQNGERIIKTNINMAGVGVNSQGTTVLPLESPTVYVNSYYIAYHYKEMVLASKHYYMGGQRIASALIVTDFIEPDLGGDQGQNPGGGDEIPVPPQEGYSNPEDGVIKDIVATVECLSGSTVLQVDPASFNLEELTVFAYLFFPYNEDNTPQNTSLCSCEQSIYHADPHYDSNTVNILYFYHSDYLGSVEFVTDMRGEAYQFFLNTPWGENLENQFARSYTAFSSRFRFNGKEWDEETGNFYYGARYYDPKISVWLSVDPLASNYPYISPYNFVENNPLMLIDPTGMGPECSNDPTGTEKCFKFSENHKFTLNFKKILGSLGDFFSRLWKGGKRNEVDYETVDNTRVIPLRGDNGQTTDINVDISDREPGESVRVDYNNYQYPDRIDVTNGEDGSSVYTTGGPVGGTGTSGDIPTNVNSVRVQVTPLAAQTNQQSVYDLRLVYSKPPDAYRRTQKYVFFGLFKITHYDKLTPRAAQKAIENNRRIQPGTNYRDRYLNQ